MNRVSTRIACLEAPLALHELVCHFSGDAMNRVSTRIASLEAPSALLDLVCHVETRFVASQAKNGKGMV